MLFIGEQYGARRDQMARYLGRRAQRATKIPGEVGATTAQGIFERWCATGWVQAVSIYKNQPDWLYLTETGLRALGLPYKPWTPPESGNLLDHKYWLNEVRLLLEEEYLHGRWVSERRLWYARTLTHPPDAEFYLPNVPMPIAIEVECSLKDSERLERILPWLATHYENTWYFVVHQEVLVRVRAKRAALVPSQQERLFLSHYDEHHQRWQTTLGQAPRRYVPEGSDQRHVEQEPKPAEQPPVSEVLQEIADEWVPPPGRQFGSEQLPRLSPFWMPQTFEQAVTVAKRLLTPADQAVLRKMRGSTQSEQLVAWSQHLGEQLGLEGSERYGIEYPLVTNRALWLACGQRDPAVIVFQLMEEVWRQFQSPPPPKRSTQLVRMKPLPPLPRAEWPSTPEEAARKARALLSPFEVLWLCASYGRNTRHDEKFPNERWMENLLDQFGLRPPQQKGAHAWNEALWRAAGTAGVEPKEQHSKVKFLLQQVIFEVNSQLTQEAEEAQPEEPQARGWYSPAFKSNTSWGEPEASLPRHQASWVRRVFLGGIKLLGGMAMLAGLGMLAFGGRALHNIVLDSVLVLLGLGVSALGIFLARQGKHRSTLR